jgi:hypothetical protein
LTGLHRETQQSDHVLATAQELIRNGRRDQTETRRTFRSCNSYDRAIRVPERLASPFEREPASMLRRAPIFRFLCIDRLCASAWRNYEEVAELRRAAIGDPSSPSRRPAAAEGPAHFRRGHCRCIPDSGAAAAAPGRAEAHRMLASPIGRTGKPEDTH